MLLKDRYDDGGISGGHLDRPGLQQLMQDIDDGRVDQIVVYKIDRLTRSLPDFAKLVERLDAVNANTSTSMQAARPSLAMSSDRGRGSMQNGATTPCKANYPCT